MSFMKIKGFPQNANLPFILHQLKNILPIAEFGKFWIRDIYDVGTNCREATLELSSQQNIIDAIKRLDQYQGTTYCLEAYQDHSTGRDKLQTSRNKGSFHESRDDYRRSSSPEVLSDGGYANSDFDIEMDLLRQQTQIMEQERMLLMKKKKLELLQEYGPDALNDLSDSPRRRQERSSGFDSHSDDVAEFGNQYNASIRKPSGYDRKSYNDNVTRFNNAQNVNKYDARVGNPTEYDREPYNEMGFDNAHGANISDVRVKNPPGFDRKSYNDNLTGFNNAQNANTYGARVENQPGFNRESYNDNVTRFDNPHDDGLVNPPHYGRGTYNDNLTGFNSPRDAGLLNPPRYGRGPHNDNITEFNNPHDAGLVNPPRYGRGLNNDNETGFNNPHDASLINLPHHGRGTYNDNLTGFNSPRDAGLLNPQHGRGTYNDDAGLVNQPHFRRGTHNDNVTWVENSLGARLENPPHYNRQPFNDNVHGFKNPHFINDDRIGFNNPTSSEQDSPSRYGRQSYNDNIPGFENPHRLKRPRNDDGPTTSGPSKRSSFPSTKTFPTQNTDLRSNSPNGNKKSEKHFRKLPRFSNTTEIIMNDIQKHIPKKHITKAEFQYLMSTINFTVRNRIVAALEGRNKSVRVDLIQLYRSLYPVNLDARLVEVTRSKYRASKLSEGHSTNSRATDDGNGARNVLVSHQHMEARNSASHGGSYMNQNQNSRNVNNFRGQYDCYNKVDDGMGYIVSPGDPSSDVNREWI